MLPEYLVDNVVEYFNFLSRYATTLWILAHGSYNPDVLDDADKDILITYAITFLAPTYINNPFLKAKLVGVSGLEDAQSDSRSCRMGFIRRAITAMAFCLIVSASTLWLPSNSCLVSSASLLVIDCCMRMLTDQMWK